MIHPAIQRFESAYTPEAAQDLVLRSVDLRYPNYVHTGAVADRTMGMGWDAYLSAYWASEYRQRGVSGPTTTAQQRISALEVGARCFGTMPRWLRHHYHQGQNAIMTLPVWRGLAGDRTAGSFTARSLGEATLPSIITSINDRLADYGRFLAGSRNELDYRSREATEPYGYLMEGVLCGLVAQNSGMRHANIVALPAPSALELPSADVHLPADVMLLRVDPERLTSRLVGGLQSKPRAVRNLGGIDEFSVVFTHGVSTVRQGRSLGDVVRQWHEPATNAALQSHLMHRIGLSGNDQLRQALGLG